jgi:SAM-dependent methyltransferase
MDSWLSYWNTPNKSYVSERHKRAHYDVIFAGIRPHLPDRNTVVLDWGCGDALAAPQIAELDRTMLLYDAAPAVRDRLRERYGNSARIRVLDEAGLDVLAGSSVDLVIVNSVIQYLSQQQLGVALATFHRLLRPGGAVLIGDVIGPGTGNLHHATTFLHFAWQRGFLLSAIGGLALTFVSPYRSLQSGVGLAAFTPAQIVQSLSQHGFAAEQLPRNIAVSQYRSSYLAHKMHQGLRARGDASGSANE